MPNFAHFALFVGQRLNTEVGDVQPFVALGKELQRSGHKVRLATHDIFETFIRDAGLDFFPIGGNPEQLMAVSSLLLLNIPYLPSLLTTTGK